MSTKIKNGGMGKLFDVLESDIVLHLSHTDLDGYGSGLVVRDFFEACPEHGKVLQYNCDYGHIMPFLEEMQEEYKNQSYINVGLIITDLNVCRDEISKIIEIFGHNWYVIDHHVNGPMEILNYPSNCTIDGSICATLLTFNTLVKYMKYHELDTENFDNRKLNIFTSTVNVYDLYLRQSFLDFNLGTWFTNIINTCVLEAPGLKRNYFYNVFNQFHSSAHVKYPVLDKRLIEFNYQYIERSWPDHEELRFILTEIYPDLRLISGERVNCSISELLELIPLNVLFTYLEITNIQNYIIHEDENMIIFNGLKSSVLTRLYDILFIYDTNRTRVLVNISNKYADMTTFVFRGKNKLSGKFASTFALQGHKGGGHDDASGASVKSKLSLPECIDMLVENFKLISSVVTQRK